MSKPAKSDLPSAVSVAALTAAGPAARRGAQSGIDIKEALRRRPTVASFIRLQKRLGASQEELLDLVQMTASTLSRRRRAKAPLDPEVGDRLWRLEDLLQRATGLVGSEARARTWLKTPAPSLEGHSPLHIARTEAGAEAVRTLITQIEYGITP